MKKLAKRAQMKLVDLAVKTKVILSDNSGEGFVDSAVFSVQRCYDRIATIRKEINSSIIKLNIKVVEVIKRSCLILQDQRGEGTVSQAISILTAVVLGSLLLMGLYKLIDEIVLPLLQEKIIEMFNYTI